MPTVKVFKAKTTLSKLLEQIETGKEKEIVIARHGRPVALLTHLATRKPGKRIGVAKGRPAHHTDPFDRMLVAQAPAEPLRLLTHDPLVAKYSDTTIHV